MHISGQGPGLDSFLKEPEPFPGCSKGIYGHWRGCQGSSGSNSKGREIP